MTATDKNCCKCNRTGRCRNCSCVKAGKHCLSCLPSCLGQCVNNNISTSNHFTASQPTMSITTHPKMPLLPSQQITVQTSTPISPISPPASANCSTNSTGIVSTNSESDSCVSAIQEKTTVLQSTSDHQEQVLKIEFPEFTPMAEPSFVWGSMDTVSFINNLDAAYGSLEKKHF